MGATSRSALALFVAVGMTIGTAWPAGAATYYSANKNVGGGWINAEGISNSSCTTWSAIRKASGSGTGHLAGQSYVYLANGALQDASAEKYSNGLTGGFTVSSGGADFCWIGYAYGVGRTGWYNPATGYYEWSWTLNTPVLWFG